MARRRQTRKNGRNRDQAEISSFWALTGAIILFLAAVFLLLGGFNTGGPLPVGMFKGVYWALGWGAYLSPLALTFFGVHKFKSEDHQIPVSKSVSMGGVLVASSSWLHVTFVNQINSVNYGGHGGSVGKLIGDAILLVIDQLPASLFLFVFAVLAILLSFGISPKTLIKLFALLKPAKKDTDLADLKASTPGFQLNEGVPVIHRGKGEATPALTNIKNTAQKLMPDQDHQALTTTRDPDWKFPSIELLNQKQDKADAGDVEGNAQAIKETFANFNIDVAMEGANVGPTVTQYTLKPPTGVKLTKLTALENNLALDLAAQSIRMEAPIPGKKLVGVEVPNIKPATVRISSIMESGVWRDQAGPLSFTIGKDISGTPIVSDLAKMPHVLIAGQTNSGKSVLINTVLTSLLYRNSPSDLKLILVDPKHVELTPYNDIPHLLTPVVTDIEKCVSALKWSVAEMERRYKTLAEHHKRNIIEYNAHNTEDAMPYIVIVIDELADLMMMAARDVESLIVRLAQKARAVGIHLVLATQSPRVTVITGLIKANIPARIAFTVAQEVESRIIIDQSGAEKLLGRGDMLFMTPDMSKPKRVQGAFITGEETNKITDFLRGQRQPQYDPEIISQPVNLAGRGGVVASMGDDLDDDLWRDAVQVVIEGGKASTSLLQRRLRVGYARAARLIETMEEQGIVGPADGARPREVLVSSADEVFNRHEPDMPDEVLDENFPEEPEEQ